MGAPDPNEFYGYGVVRDHDAPVYKFCVSYGNCGWVRHGSCNTPQCDSQKCEDECDCPGREESDYDHCRTCGGDWEITEWSDKINMILPDYDYPEGFYSRRFRDFRRRLGAFSPAPVQSHDSFLLPLLAVAVLLLWVGWLVARRFRGSPRRERRRSSLAEPDLRLLEEGRYRRSSL